MFLSVWYVKKILLIYSWGKFSRLVVSWYISPEAGNLYLILTATEDLPALDNLKTIFTESAPCLGFVTLKNFYQSCNFGCTWWIYFNVWRRYWQKKSTCFWTVHCSNCQESFSPPPHTIITIRQSLDENIHGCHKILPKYYSKKTLLINAYFGIGVCFRNCCVLVLEFYLLPPISEISNKMVT